ncbi:sigma-70 family RNA polymerase sigma factor [bacterium]|nr:sigma-70 family RNA polymerase sigma factor [bacterium]
MTWGYPQMTNPSLETHWHTIETAVINRIKIQLMRRHADDILTAYEPRLKKLVRGYAKHLPDHIQGSETDDLYTVAQLELLESFKVWLPSRCLDFWGLANLRIVGALKDHVRFVSKGDAYRLYDWITDSAYVMMAVSDRADFQHTIDTGIQLTQVMSVLTDREKSVVVHHSKEDLTFRQIGELLGISESQISRIYKRAIDKMRHHLSVTQSGEPDH